MACFLSSCYTHHPMLFPNSHSHSHHFFLWLWPCYATHHHHNAAPSDSIPENHSDNFANHIPLHVDQEHNSVPRSSLHCFHADWAPNLEQKSLDQKALILQLHHPPIQ